MPDGCVELARLRRQAARQIGVTDDQTPGVLDHFARHGEIAVAALFGRQIDLTPPSVIDSIMPAVISFGAGLPGSARW
jgi:hypothetical protein